MHEAGTAVLLFYPAHRPKKNCNEISFITTAVHAEILRNQIANANKLGFLAHMHTCENKLPFPVYKRTLRN